MRSKNIVILLVVACVFRIFLMLWSFEHPVHKDILRFRDWASIPYVYNLRDPYEGKHLTFGISPLNMPPGTLYILTSAYRVNLLAARVIMKVTHTQPGELIWVNVWLTNAFLRIPGIMSDLLIGYLIYAIVRKYRNQKNALFASGLFLCNPSIFYISSFWGQMDSIHNALFILALYVFYRGKQFLSLLFLFLSLYVKLTIVVLIVPLLFIMFLLNTYKIKFIAYVAFVIAFILLVTLPISNAPHIWFYEFLQKNSLGEMDNITSLATNFWWAVFKPRMIIGDPTSDFSFTLDRFVGSPSSATLFLGLSLFNWALVALFLVSLPLLRLVYLLKEKFFKPEILFLLLSLFSLLAYLFLPHMHERYLYPFIPLMAIYIGLKSKYLWIFCVISLLNFLNIYIVWHPMVNPALPYWLMNNENFQWMISFGTVLATFVLYVKVMKSTLIDQAD